MLWQKKRKLIFCFSFCYHGQAWKQRSFHWCLHAVSGDKKKKGKEGKACSIHWGNEFRTLHSCAQHINISVTKMESDVKTTTLGLGPGSSAVTVKPICKWAAHLWAICMHAHGYGQDSGNIKRRLTWLTPSQPIKTPENQHSPIIFDFIVSKI